MNEGFQTQMQLCPFLFSPLGLSLLPHASPGLPTSQASDLRIIPPESLSWCLPTECWACPLFIPFYNFSPIGFYRNFFRGATFCLLRFKNQLPSSSEALGQGALPTWLSGAQLLSDHILIYLRPGILRLNLFSEALNCLFSLKPVVDSVN